MAVGIDPSLTSTGLARREMQQVVTQAVTTTSEEPWYIRVRRIRDNTLAFIGDDKVVYMEDYAYGSKFSRELLGELGGVIREGIEGNGIKIIKIPPTKVKMFATGRGAAPSCPVGQAKSTWKKKWMMEEVKKNFKQEFDTDDETDAFVIATIGMTVEMARNNPTILETLPIHQRRVVLDLLKEDETNGKNHSKSGSRKCPVQRGGSNRKKSSRGQAS
jgi:Holliday junction resolvasome RuvABC endonuclease subunit